MHPSDEQLIQYLEDVAEPAIRKHLDRNCPACAVRIEAIRAVMAAMRSDRDPDPPEAWVARAVALRAHAQPSRLLDQLRDWVGGIAEEVARVISDTASPSGQLAIAGIRSASGARRLRFESDQVELDLQIEPEAGTSIVTGQFATSADRPAPIEGAAFLVIAGGRQLIQGTTDQLGEFSVDTQAGDLLELRLRHQDRVVRFDVPPESHPAP